MHRRPQVPQGATPRNLTVHLRGALTRTAKPGDAVTVAGVFLPEPFTGFRAMRAGLLTSVYLQARSVAGLQGLRVGQRVGTGALPCRVAGVRVGQLVGAGALPRRAAGVTGGQGAGAGADMLSAGLADMRVAGPAPTIHVVCGQKCVVDRSNVRRREQAPASVPAKRRVA